MPHTITYMWALKRGTNEPICRTEWDSQRERIDLRLQGVGRRCRERDGLGSGLAEGNRRIWRRNKVLLYSKGTMFSLLG